MVVSAPTEEMSDDEIEVVSAFLDRVKGGSIPNIEALDGFLTALVIWPNIVQASEFMPVITKGDTEDGNLVFENTDEAETFLVILMNHWNRINRTYTSGEAYLPMLFEDERGELRGNDWAKGFLRGTHLRRADWMRVNQSEEHGGLFASLWSLAADDHPDPDNRSIMIPFNQKQRKKFIGCIISGARQLFDYFHWRQSLPHKAPYRGGPWADPDRPEDLRLPRTMLKRNNPCFCDSGRAFTKCCGAVTLH